MDDLEDALAQAVAACFVGGIFERRCGAWQVLRDNVRARAADQAWRTQLLSLLDAEGKRVRLALELLTEGALVLVPKDHEAVRARLWRVTDATDRPAEIRALAIRALGKVLDAPTVSRLISLLDSDSAEVRAAVTYLLGEPQPSLVAERKAVVNALLAVLNSEAEGDEVRGAVRSLGALQVEAAVVGLIKRLDDRQVGANAAMALAGLKDQRGYEALMKRLETVGAESELAPALIGALSTLALHPNFERDRADRALAAIESALASGASRRPDAAAVRDLAHRARAALALVPSAQPDTPAKAPLRAKDQAATP